MQTNKHGISIINIRKNNSVSNNTVTSMHDNTKPSDGYRLQPGKTVGICPLCGHTAYLSVHHLYPSGIKFGGDSANKKIKICTWCHETIHTLWSNLELGTLFYNVYLIKNNNLFKKQLLSYSNEYALDTEDSDLPNNNTKKIKITLNDDVVEDYYHQLKKEKEKIGHRRLNARITFSIDLNVNNLFSGPKALGKFRESNLAIAICKYLIHTFENITINYGLLKHKINIEKIQLMGVNGYVIENINITNDDI